MAADTPVMRRLIPPVFMLWAGVAHAAVVQVPIKSAVELKPNEAYAVTIESSEPVEIGWGTVQAKACTTPCVQATDVTGGINYRIALPLGGSMKYKPVSGKITVEYKNVSSEPVTINIYRVRRTCESEACKFLDDRQKSRWLVFKVDEFTSITTSRDGSYSVISGVVLGGKPFTARFVWWSEEKTRFGLDCSPFVKRYLDNKTPKDQFSPFIISGYAIGEAPNLVLNKVDTCAAKAPNFGVPAENVFK
jgi:hypothetical protein